MHRLRFAIRIQGVAGMHRLRITIRISIAILA
jgi:hypothetical protein